MLIFIGIPLAIAVRIFAWRWLSRLVLTSSLSDSFLKLLVYSTAGIFIILLLVALYLEYQTGLSGSEFR